ncbi:MAG: amidohydrolase [Treponema sp.]|jgi:predicted amidohydrolase YtcJ|nr:amidohydrolase [Treponema sp.]
MLKFFYNGKCWLGGNYFANTILVDKERIALVGLDDAPQRAEKIDLEGALVLPAFYDSHLHLLWLGRSEASFKTAGASSLAEALDRGRAHLRLTHPAPGALVEGVGLDPDAFSGGKREPDRSDLDSISREHPVVLQRHCGHTVYCNSAALALAGLSEKGPAVEGGVVEVDAGGRPSGILRENAANLVRAKLPSFSDAQIRAFLDLAMQKALSLGITAAGSFDSDGPDCARIMGIYRKVYAERELKQQASLRITVQAGVRGKEEFIDAFAEQGISTGDVLAQSAGGSALYRMGAVKLFADGTLGGHTAWLSAPYTDRPDTEGYPVLAPPVLARLVRKAAEQGLQVLIHAIGDAGVDSALSAFEALPEAARKALRPGIIHCQITNGALLRRMARAGVQALVQPVFLADDSAILERRVGPERALQSYAWGAMERTGVITSYGTDAPVSPLNPFEGVSWAVCRRDTETDPAGQGFAPEEKVPLRTALRCYTGRAAWSAFDEKRLGLLRPGFLADFITIDRDIFHVPEEEIRRARVTRVWMGGRELRP